MPSSALIFNICFSQVSTLKKETAFMFNCSILFCLANTYLLTLKIALAQYKFCKVNVKCIVLQQEYF